MEGSRFRSRIHHVESAVQSLEEQLREAVAARDAALQELVTAGDAKVEAERAAGQEERRKLLTAMNDDVQQSNQKVLSAKVPGAMWVLCHAGAAGWGALRVPRASCTGCGVCCCPLRPSGQAKLDGCKRELASMKKDPGPQHPCADLCTDTPAALCAGKTVA